jgi:hypothetical protein
LPLSSIPSTIRPNNHSRSGFGFDPILQTEIEPFQENAVDMMTVDNLPNEMPRDASRGVWRYVYRARFTRIKKAAEMLTKATIATNKDLGTHFEYLHLFEGRVTADT